MPSDIFTIGHSSQSGAAFLHRLRRHAITAVADVRSSPFSRHNPQFNREELRGVLQAEGICYVFLGNQLGGRSGDDWCTVNNRIRYDLLAQTDSFRTGIARVIEGAESFRIALMCAEKDPLDCHRTILVARELTKRGRSVQHILIDGSLETHRDAISRLIAQSGLLSQELFRSSEDAINEAYARQEDRIADDRKGRQSSRERSAGRPSCEDKNG